MRHRDSDQRPSAAYDHFRRVRRALNPSLARNDLVLPEAIIDTEGNRHPVDLPEGLGARIRHAKGTLLTVDHVVLKAAQKAELRATYQADLIDMESSAVAALCSESLIRFFSIRVISDDALTDLPREVASVLAHGGSYRVGAAIRAVWQRPRSIKDFWGLYENAIEASGLARQVRHVVPGRALISRGPRDKPFASRCRSKPESRRDRDRSAPANIESFSDLRAPGSGDAGFACFAS